MIAVISLVLILILSLILVRIATIALTLTGLPRSMAAFQARSALTGTGFTTSESEKVVNHPVRRRIVTWLMILRNGGIVTIFATIVLGFLRVDAEQGSLSVRIGVLLLGMLLLWAVATSAWFERRLRIALSRFLRDHTGLVHSDLHRLMHLSGDFVVAELQVKAGDWLAGRSLGHLRLRDEGVLVLGITRPGGDYLGVPDRETVIEPEQTLIVYGHRDVLERLDHRPDDLEGQREHDEQSRSGGDPNPKETRRIESA